MSSDAFDPERPLPPPVEDWAARIDELLLEAETVPTGAERTAVLCRISEIYERRLGDANGALVTLQTALAEDPTSGRVIRKWSGSRGETAFGRAGRGHRRGRRRARAKEAGGRPLGADRLLNETGRAQLDEATRRPNRAGAEAAHGGALALLEISTAGSGSRSLRRDPGASPAAPGADPTKVGDAYREVLATSRGTPARSVGSPRCTKRRRVGGRRRGPAPPRRRVARRSGRGRGAVSAGQAARGTALRSARGRGAAGARAGGGRRRTHVPSLLLLAAIYRERKDWLKARQLLGRAAAVVTDVADRTRILGEAAEICATALDDEVQAADLYAEYPGARRHPNRPRREAGRDQAAAR